MPKTFHAETRSDVQLAVRSSSKIRIVGNGTKDLSYKESFDIDEIDKLVVTRIAGILEYDSSEFTVTAKAGTRVDDLKAILAEQGQFLPFDPPLVDQGATLGGMIAAGISGPSRLRFGGIRDFILGVQFVDGTGAIAKAGGKVVKNAAGFDIPKLMVGSWGELGVLTEVTLKVFPRPLEYCSIKLDASDIGNAIALMHRLVRSPLEIDALDLEDSRFLLVRLGGLAGAIEKAAERVAEIARDFRSLTIGESQLLDQVLWTPLLDWSWCRESEQLIRVPLTSTAIMALDAELAKHSARCRFSVAGNVAWIAWPISNEISSLDRILHSLQLDGRIVRGGNVQSSQVGVKTSQAFAQRILHAMDPENRFARRK